MTSAPILSRTTLSQQVAAEIRERIMTGRLGPGARLNETELAAEFGVSPTPVREALHRLRGDGLIVYSAWQGATVVELTPQDVMHLYDIRQSLECLAVREAAGRLTDADFALLDSLIERAPAAIAAADAQALHELNEEFHQVFLARSENRWLQQMLGGLSDLLILARRQLTLARSGREAWAEHKQIVTALRAGDVATAESAMAAHIGRVKGELLGQLAGEQRS